MGIIKRKWTWQMPGKAVIRQVLAASGIIISIGLATLLIGLAEGGRLELERQYGMEGSRLFVIKNDSGYDALEDADLRILTEKMKEVRTVVPVYKADIMLESYKAKKLHTMFATSAEYRSIYNLELLYGRFITAHDHEKMSRITVIDAQSALALFGTVNAVGQQVRTVLAGEEIALTVAGVCRNPAATPVSYLKEEFENFCFIPDTLINRIAKDDHIDRIIIAVPDVLSDDEVESKINYYLKKENSPGGNYRIEGYRQLFTVEAFFEDYGYMLAAIFLIALLGGITTLSSVLLIWKENNRKRIGLQKFYGASKSDIRWEVILKSIRISIMCGMAGVILGYTGGIATGFFLGVSMVLTFPMLAAGFFVAVAAGVAAGIFPAIQSGAVDEYDVIFEA